MAYSDQFLTQEPSRADLAAAPGDVLLEFGTPWCGHCQAAQPAISVAMAEHVGLSHLKVEDGPGRPLGRAFKVKLWPTLILVRAGEELGRVVRPGDAAAVRALLARSDEES